MPYKLSKDGLCVLKADTGDTVKCHDTHEQAVAHLKALEMNVMMQENHSVLISEFVNVKAGEPYRLFPFGRIIKNGKTRDITPEFARTITLPHFKPAIKLGSHEDTTPAGGHIIALEVRQDGLYAVPELNEKGAQALQDGAYRYHSPEIIWEGGLENPATGEIINQPVVVGDALLHTPHLGEAAALYSVEEITQESNMNENINIPQSFWDKFVAPLLSKPAEVKEVIKEVIPEEYTLALKERDELKAQMEKQQAETARKTRVEKYETDLKATKADPTLSELLADLAPDKAELVMKQFKALSEQINESNLTTEQGSAEDGGNVDPKTQFNSLVTKLSIEKNMNYVDAFDVTKKTHAALFMEAFGKK